MLRRPRGTQPASGNPDAFFSQAPETMLTALERPMSALVPDVKARAFGDAVEAVRRAEGAGLPLVLVYAAESPHSRVPVRNAIEVARLYISAQDQCQRVIRKWKAELPRRRKKNEALRDREGASRQLRQQLRIVFPNMAERTLEELVDTCVHRQEASQERAKLIGNYVGGLLADGRAGASTIRTATSEAGRARARWQPFLRWIETTRPLLAREMAALSEILEWYRYWLAGPLPVNYYRTFGPLFLNLLRVLAHAPQAHPDAAAVHSWLMSLTDAEIEQWPTRRDWRSAPV